MDGEPAVAAGVLSFESRDPFLSRHFYDLLAGRMDGWRKDASRLHHTLALELRDREEMLSSLISQ